MRYGRRRHRHDDRNYKKKGRFKPKLAIAGIITFIIGVLLINYSVTIVKSSGNLDDPLLVSGYLGIFAGTLMGLFSLSRKQGGKVVGGIDNLREAFKEPCHCCKCTNCDRNHNHWTHD